jgi:hypothetical protein
MKRLAPVLDRDALTAEIASLSKLGIDELRERWKTLYGKEPSGHIGRSFLTRAIRARSHIASRNGLTVDSNPRPDAFWLGPQKRARLKARRRNPSFGRPNREPC